MGRWITRRFLLRFLEVRLQLTAYVRADPGVVDEEIPEPVFVAGAPRTGTTILHALLAQDPARPGPARLGAAAPGTAARSRHRGRRPPHRPRRPRAAPARRRHRRARRHPRVRRPPAQGVRVGAHVLVPLRGVHRALPRARATSTWLQQCDMRPAYEMHKTVLQMLQRRDHDVHWVLKSPAHMHWVPTILSVYPDARLAFTHRDPITILASVTSLVATLRYAHSDAVDFADIGAYHERLYQGALDHLVTWSERRHPRSRPRAPLVLRRLHDRSARGGRRALRIARPEAGARHRRRHAGLPRGPTEGPARRALVLVRRSRPRPRRRARALRRATRTTSRYPEALVA